MLILNMCVGVVIGFAFMPIYYLIATSIFGNSLVTHEEYMGCVAFAALIYLIINLGRA